MNRREALSLVAWITGGLVAGSDMMLQGCTSRITPNIKKLFDPLVIDMLGDVAETILPKTNSPGAKEAGVGEFIPVMVRDCYSRKDQAIFMDGIAKLEDVSGKRYKRKFQELSPEERKNLLIGIDREMKEYKSRQTEGQPNHYFDLFKQLTLLGYFTSEAGATQALRYLQIPGRYDGSYSYKKGDRAWAI